MLVLRALALMSITTVLAACGGDGGSSQAGAGTTPPASKARLSPTTDPDGSKGPAPARSNEVAASDGAEVTLTPGGSRQAAAPCTLVSRAQAAAIVGEPVLKPLEAPQGPTCVYRYGGGKRLITLAVQSVDVKSLKRELRAREPVNVSRKAAFCGHRGQPTLYVPLSSRQVLSIAAPCAVAREFAALALKRLHS